MKVVWSPLAVERVEEIARYIAQDKPAAAEQWVKAVFDKVWQTVLFPESGRLVPEVRRRDLRELVFGNYRIIYRLGSTEIAVLTVRHFKQILPVEEITDP